MYVSKDEVEAMRKESQARRIAHPNWPSHKPTLYHPHGRGTVVFETMPIGKAKGLKGYCKYCYTKHANWWAMDPREKIDDQPGNRLVLCGRCEHTSLESMLSDEYSFG